MFTIINHRSKSCAKTFFAIVSLPVLLGLAVTPQSSDLGHRLQQVLQEQLTKQGCWYRGPYWTGRLTGGKPG